MSIEATKKVTTVSGLPNRNLINKQNKKAKVSALQSSSLTFNSNVKLNQNTIAMLHKIADEIIKQTFEHIDC